MSKILHVIPDSVFTETAVRQFEAAAPGESKYFGLGGTGTFKYSGGNLLGRITHDDLLREVQEVEYRSIVIHQMTYTTRKLLRKIPQSKKVAWVGWGFDYYDCLLHKEYPHGLLLERTEGATNRQCHARNENRSSNNFFKRVISRTGVYRMHLNSMLKRVDIFSPVLDVEYELIRRHNRWFNAEYHEWNYGDLGSLVPGGPAKIDGNDILFGNSSTPSNNHLDGIEILKNFFDLDGRKIVCPLSYGDASYAKCVRSEAERLFHGQFEPLLNFMPLPEYNRITSKCQYVFMFHRRQQGLGSILSRMYSGANVYLLKSNPIYVWFKRRGGAVFSIDDIVSSCRNGNSKVVLTPLSQTEIQKNKHIIENHWGSIPQHERTMAFVNKLL